MIEVPVEKIKQIAQWLLYVDEVIEHQFGYEFKIYYDDYCDVEKMKVVKGQRSVRSLCFTREECLNATRQYVSHVDYENNAQRFA